MLILKKENKEKNHCILWKEGTRDIQMERHCALGCAEKQDLSKMEGKQKGVHRGYVVLFV